MMESIELIVGAGIMGFGFIAGFVTSRVSQRLGFGRAPKAICESCADGLGYHDDNGACHALHERKAYNATGRYIGKRQHACTCQKYVGTLPADRMLASFLPPSESKPPTS